MSIIEFHSGELSLREKLIIYEEKRWLKFKTITVLAPIFEFQDSTQ